MNDFNNNTSIWDHINDLRFVMIRAALVVFVGLIICLLFHEPILNLLTANWQAQSHNTLNEQEIKRFTITNHSTTTQQFKVPQGTSTQAKFVEITPGESFSYEIASSPKLLLLGPLDGILQTFRVCFWISLALTSPCWGWILLTFILPGLNRQEKQVVFPFLACSVISVSLAIFLAHHVTIPISNTYLQLFNSSIGQNAWTFGNYIDYTLLIYLGHVIAFELALLLFLGVHYGLISEEWLSSKRRYMIVLAFILGALLTPPDVFTQLMLAIPLVCLFELTILYARLRGYLALT